MTGRRLITLASDVRGGAVVSARRQDARLRTATRRRTNRPVKAPAAVPGCWPETPGRLRNRVVLSLRHAVKVLEGQLVEVLAGQAPMGQRVDVGARLADVAPSLAWVQRRRIELVHAAACRRRASRERGHGAQGAARANQPGAGWSSGEGRATGGSAAAARQRPGGLAGLVVRHAVQFRRQPPYRVPPDQAVRAELHDRGIGGRHALAAPLGVAANERETLQFHSDGVLVRRCRASRRTRTRKSRSGRC